MTEVKRPYIIQDPINRLTIGIKLDAENRVYAVVALCNPKDQYTRRVGYTKVMGMLSSPNLKPLGVYTGPDWKTSILPKIKQEKELFLGLLANIRRRHLGDATTLELDSWNDRTALRNTILHAIATAENVATIVEVTA